MKLTTTFNLLRKAKACEPSYVILRGALKGVKYDEPISLLTILKTNGFEDALWALRATSENCDKVARLMAADFAEQVLPIWRRYSTDQRPQLAIKAARGFANGRITSQELAAARAAARSAAQAAAQAAAGSAAWAAWAAARSAAQAAHLAAVWAAATPAAAGSAAGSAAWAKQEEIFCRYLHEEA